MKSILLILLTTAFLFGEVAMAQQQTDETIEQYITRLEAETKRDNAEKDRLNAEASRLTAELALIKAQSVDQDTDLEKTRVELETQLINADKARSDAELAALKADLAKVTEPLSAITGTDIKGEVKLGTDAGKLEAALLASDAMTVAAGKIAAQINYKIDDTITTFDKIILVKTTDGNPVVSLISLRALQNELRRQHSILSNETDFNAGWEAYSEVFFAIEGSNPAPIRGGSESFIATVATAGAILDAGSKLLSYFKTDYTLGSVNVEFDDDVLMTALAGQFNGNAATLSTLKWAYSGDDIDVIIQEFDTEKTDVRNYEQKIIALNTRVNRLKTRVESLEDDDLKKELLTKLTLSTERIKAANTLISGFSTEYAGYVKGVGNADSSIFIGKLLPALAYERFVKDGTSAVLRVKVEFVGGSYYTKRNIGTSLGGMPYEAAGGTVVSFALIDATTGVISKSGIIPVHGGYSDIDNLAQDTRFKR